MNAAIVTGLFVFAVAAIVIRILLRYLRIERQRRIALERWLRGNLMHIRAECGFISPQTTSLINSLERALPMLAPVDAVGLRRVLAEFQREHDNHLIEETQHWCKVRAAVAAEAAKGEPLPGLDGGAS